MFRIGRSNFFLFFLVLILISSTSYFYSKNYRIPSNNYISPAEIPLHSGDPLNVKLLKGDWQEFLKADYHLYVHKAFIEFRDVWLGNGPFIVVPSLLRASHVSNYHIECEFLVDDKWIRDAARIERMSNSWRYKYTGWQTVFVLCPIPQNPPHPSHVKLINPKRDESVTLVVEFQETGKYKLTTCVPILYGNFNSEALIEWFEFQKYFGVDKVSMHVWKVSNENWKVFDYYRANGLLDLYKLDAPYKISYKFQTQSNIAADKPFFLEALYTIDLFECMMRNYQRTEYVLVQDVDEVLVPQEFKDYHGLINKYREFDDLVFPMVNFDVTCNFTIPNEKHFHFQRPFRLDPKPFNKQSPGKSLHRTDRCAFFLQHNCIKYLKKYRKYKRQLLTYDEAVLRHYRKHSRCINKVKQSYGIDKRLNEFSKDLDSIITDAKMTILSSSSSIK